MKMTRRAFFMHPNRLAWEDPENAGEWLRRARQKESVPLPGGGGTAATVHQTIPVTARGLGLRNARANMRRNEHE